MELLTYASAWLVLLVIFAGTMLVLVTVFFNLWVMVPFVPTPNGVIKGMVELADLKKGEVVMDLGAGDARILLEAEKRQPKIKAIGYEGALGVWMLAKLRIVLRGSRVKMSRENFFNIDLSKADVIFTYLSIATMKKLKLKLDRELKPGARLIAHAFRVPDMTPDKQVLVPMSFGKGTKIFRYVWKAKR